MERKKTLTAALIVMGISGIIAQILLLRELLINFYGNELSIGIILANWLLLESAGAFFLGKRVEKTRLKIELFIFVTLMFAIFLPGAVYVARALRSMLGGIAQEAAGISRIFYSSFLVFLPVSLTHGALFTFGCKIYSSFSEKSPGKVSKEAASVGKVYIYETIGTLLGGIALTFLLIPYIGSFQIAFALSLLNIIICIVLAQVSWETRRPRLLKILSALSLLLLIIFSYILFSPVSNKIHLYSLRFRWPGQQVVLYQNSIYGNIAVTKSHQQYTFFSDGIPVITVPTPDISSIEEFVHLPMLSHPDPGDILIISGGAGGVINEILKHNVKKIDYVELDPLLLKAVKMFPVELTVKELSDPGVNIEHIDGKLFIKKTPLKYDVIFIGLDDASSLSVNRLFTEEFFILLEKRLSTGGIIAFKLPGSLTYLNDEMKNLNACILNALKSAFLYTKIIPGDSENIYMASSSYNIAKIKEAGLIERFNERDIPARLMSAFHIQYKLQPQREKWVLESLEAATKKKNQDFNPIGTFFSLAYWNAMFSPRMQPVLRMFEKTSLRIFAIIFSIIGVIMAFVCFFSKNPLKISVPLSIASTGFAGMLFDLVIIFAFQIVYGYVFYWLGILVSVFMAGALGGSLWATRIIGRIKNELNLFVKTEAVVIAFALALPFAIASGWQHSLRLAFLDFKVIFLLAALMSGIIVGMQFPLANKIYLSQARAGISETAGLLYGCDLLGGWISGMIGGVVLIPILGVWNTCLVIVFLKLMTFIVFALSMIKTGTHPVS